MLILNWTNEYSITPFHIIHIIVSDFYRSSVASPNGCLSSVKVEEQKMEYENKTVENKVHTCTK